MLKMHVVRKIFPRKTLYNFLVESDIYSVLNFIALNFKRKSIVRTVPRVLGLNVTKNLAAFGSC